jgi:carbon-monoxide dehydrogenase large subunit
MTLMDDRPPTGHVGRSLRRKEDPRLITGQATYVDDLAIVGMLHAAFVRSPEAHARVVSIDASSALERDDVVAVFTGDDLADLASPLPMAWAPDGVQVNNPEHWPLARGTVKHVGDPVAVVLSQDRYAAVDAAEEVLVEYEPLPVVTDIETALDEGAPLVHEQFGTNRTHDWSLGGGDLEAGFAEADVIVERRVVNHRISGAPIEPRGVLADYRAGSITVHSSTQVPHFVRLFMGLMLGISEQQVRIIAPEVGGGFGAKLQVTGEEILCAWASRRTGRPVKWIETRSEHMAVCHHGRDQVATVRLGAKRDGTLTALHARILADMGAYLMLLTPTIPSLGAFVMGGVYKIPAVQTDITGVFTNKVATDAIRGAGRPEATHMIEVGMDQLADELGMDRLELRRKNFIPKEDFPAEVAYGIVYDSGDYAGRAGQAPDARRPGGLRAGAGRAGGQGHRPRHRLLHVHGDLRPRALPGHRARGLRPADGPVGVGHRPRDGHGQRHGLHGDLAARPGPRDHHGAGRRRQARGGSPAGRDPPRRHGHGRDGPGHVRLAHHRGGHGVRRPGGRRGGPQVQGHRRPRARGRARRTSSCRTGASSSRARRTRA